MKQETDKLIREKLAGLDTLSAGIVFDKEAAWKKLEPRVNNKPSKKVAAWYWLGSAAAALVVVFFLLQEHSGRKIELAKTAIPQLIAQPESQPDNEYVNVVLYKEKKHDIEIPKQDNTSLNIHTLQTPVASNEVAVITPKQDSVVPVIAKTAIKVVHINDLSNEQNVRPVALPQQRLVKIRVPLVHINEPWEERYNPRGLYGNINILNIPISNPSLRYKAVDMDNLLPNPVATKN